jgi:hypothetical protein
MERVIYKYVFNHLQRNKLIYEYQSGFLPKCRRDLLKIIWRGAAIFSGQIFNILWLIISDGDDEKCELLNKYFSFISSLEDANVPLPDIELKTDNFLRDIVITTEEIVDIIKIINPNKASGPDIISHKMLKICPEKIAAQIFI